MARELSQEAVLDFLCRAGGRAPNTALLRHFQRFLRDPALTEQQQRERREYFKSLVNSLATVHPAAAPGASKDIVLRRRYRDLLDEELPPPQERPQQEEEKDPPPPRRDPDRRRGPPGEAVEKGRPGGGRLGGGQPGGGQPREATVAGGCAARGRGGLCCECRRARRAAAAAAPPGPGAPPPAGPPCSRFPPPPPYRTQPLSSGTWALHPDGPPRSRPPALPSSPGAPIPAGPPRSRPPVLPSGPGALTPAGPPRSRSPPLPPAGSPPYQTLQPPSAKPSRSRSPPLSPGPRVLPPTGSASSGSLPPQGPRGPPPSQSLPLPSGPGVLPPGRLPQCRSPPQPRTRMPLLKTTPPSAGPGGRLPPPPSQSPLLSSGPRVLSLTGPPLSRSPEPPLADPLPPQSLPLLSAPGVLSLSRSPEPPLADPLPSQSLTLLSAPGVLPLSRSPEPPLADPLPSQSLTLLSAPGVLSLSRSLQALPASPSPAPPLLSGPDVLPSTRLPPSQSRSLQQLPTSPSPCPLRGPRVLTPNRPTQSQALLLHPTRLHSYHTLPLPSGPGVLAPTRPPPSQSPPWSPTQPPPSQSLMPAQSPTGAQAPERSPPAPLPVFRSIRCQLALLEVPSSLSDDCQRQLRTMPSKSSPRNVPSRGLSVPLGRREHAWLVAVSAGCWAQVRGLFLEEPELALQRDFMSGFTVLHWLAKHGDGPGLQELAAAAQQAGLALDVDARSGCGYTPLHLAAIHGHQLVIKVLVLQLGCQVQVRDGSGRRPWEYLGSSTSGEIWQLLEAPRGTIMFPTQPLARSVSSVSKVSLSTGRTALPACLRPQHGRGAASHRTCSESD